MSKNTRHNILFVSSEASPYAKTGGLADVAGSLPQYLFLAGNDVRVVIPKYKSIEHDTKYVCDFSVEMKGKKETCIVREHIQNKKSGDDACLRVYFIDNYHYFCRDGIYCFYDDAERFAFFCKALLNMLPQIDFKPDVIHCNDWHSGPVCMLLKEKFSTYPFYKEIATLFTIHNLEYQGIFEKDTLDFFDLEEDVFIPEKVEFYGSFNFIKSGIVYSDIINTVSENYSKEIQTPEFGQKLEGLLKKKSNTLYGIVNGISYKDFNPQEDPRLYRNYNHETIDLKSENKHDLQKILGLPVADVPVLSFISRLTDQKGVILLLKIIDKLAKMNIQLVVLGIGNPEYEKQLQQMQHKYPKIISSNIEFNPTLAQKIYAGSDMFIMPSRFEPCGLGQIISMRYGTVPIVRSVGGLKDTVKDYNDDKLNGNGFCFSKLDSNELLKAIKRALKLYTQDRAEWASLAKRIMQIDFSWEKSSKKYIELYNKAMATKKE